MSRQIDWSLVPDIEYLDAYGVRNLATAYPDGRLTVDDLRTFDPDQDQL